MSAPRAPVAPVIKTLRFGSIGRGIVSTTLPTFLPSRRWRKASGAWRMSQLLSGEWRSSPDSKSSTVSASICADPLGAGFAGAEGAVGEAGVSGGDAGGLADVGLAHLQEAPAAGQELQRGVDELARQGVEDDVDPLPPVTSRNFSSKPSSREEAM